MKPITINVSESIYREFQRHAKASDRTTSELIREAMEAFWRERIQPRTSLRDLQSLSLGEVLQPLDSEDDILGEMLGD